MLLTIFSKLKLNKYGKRISKLSSFALGVYLLQNNHTIWNTIISNCSLFLIENNIIIIVLGVIGLSFVLFIIGMLVDYIRFSLFKLLKIDKLSNWLSKKVELIINKVIAIL